MDKQDQVPKLKVANVWSEFAVQFDGNPQHYLLKAGHESITLAGKFLDGGKKISDPGRYFFYTQAAAATYSLSLVSRIKNRLLQPVFWRRFNQWAYSILKSQQPTHIHAHFGHTAVRILPLIKKLKLPLIVTYYGVDGSSLVQQPRWRKGYQEMFKYASGIIVLSEVVRQRLHAIGCPLEKITVWNIPIKLETYQYRERVQGDTVKFITAARFVEKKGYPFLVAAFEKVKQQYNNCTLTIIGYGPEKGRIEELAVKHHVQESVSVNDTKMQPDFVQYYYKNLCEHHIFVLPSTTSRTGDDEGGPSLTLVAAQASGLPVICTPFAGSEVSVFDQKTGIISPTDNADALADNMIHLVRNPQRWDELGKAASEYVHHYFSEELQAKALIGIYVKTQQKTV
jgi:colanic acid/amylovoran biosynthesis glycosyltransferase